MDICINCFKDKYVIDFIKTKNKIGKCDFCGESSIYICSIDDLRKFIMKGINKKYENYYNSLECPIGKEAREVFDSFTNKLNLMTILTYEEDIFSDLLDENEKMELVKKIFENSDNDPGEEIFIEKEWLYDIEQILFHTWDEFKGFILHSNRFFDFGNINRKRILAYLINELLSVLPNAKRIINKDKKFYRARKFDKIEDFENKEKYKKELGPPPYKVSLKKNNRMSPPGISYFYVADDIETCLKEIDASITEKIIIGEFMLKKEIKILDLSNFEISDKQKKEYTNIFSKKYKHKYIDLINYFKSFAEDISKPINDDDEIYEYIPTQVLTEFIRKVEFDGIKYKSSKNPKGNNYVLFFGPEDSPFIKNFNKTFELNNYYLYRPNLKSLSNNSFMLNI